MSRSPEEHLANAREHLRMINVHLERHDLDDATVFDAVAMRLSSAIESLQNLDEDLRMKVFGDLWHAIWSVRNRLAHGYTYVDKRIIEATVENELGELSAAIDELEAELLRAASDETAAGSPDEPAPGAGLAEREGFEPSDP